MVWGLNSERSRSLNDVYTTGNTMPLSSHAKQAAVSTTWRREYGATNPNGSDAFKASKLKHGHYSAKDETGGEGPSPVLA